MEFITLKDKEKQGFPVYYNVIDFKVKIWIPEGKYFQNGKQLIVAHEYCIGNFVPSNKHSYLVDKEG